MDSVLGELISKKWEPKEYRIHNTHFWDLTSAKPTQSHLITYRHGGYHNGQRSFLGAANAEISHIKVMEFFWATRGGTREGNEDGLLSSPTY